MILPLLHTDCFQHLAQNAHLMSLTRVCIYAYEYTHEHIRTKSPKWASIWQEALLAFQTHALALATEETG